MNLADHIFASDHCDLCGADVFRQGKVVASGAMEHPRIKIRLNTVVCRECRFVYQRERFTEELLSDLYGNDTSFDFGSKAEETAKVRAGLLERQAVISRAMNAAGIRPPASVLDVGGGRGECCKHLVDQHRVVVADATSAEPVDPRIEKLPGLLNSNITEAAFDVVIMNHVLEHVFSPTDLLGIGSRALKPGGTLIVEVPFELYTPLLFRHLGDWRHVAYFSRHTLSRFLEKTGFTVSRLELEMGAYAARRLPVIRAVARKEQSAEFPHRTRLRRVAPLLADMAAPVVLASLARRALGR